MNSNSWIKGFGGANIFHDNRCQISWYIVDIPDIEFGRIVLESEIPLKSEILPPLVARRNVLPDRLSLFCNDVDERLVDAVVQVHVWIEAEVHEIRFVAEESIF